MTKHNGPEKKVFLGRGAFKPQVEQMFWSRGWETTTSPLRAVFLCLLGGPDISPELYEEKTLQGTYCVRTLDEIDVGLFKIFRDMPKLGICRGGQLLNVLSGGKMWQHINRHGGEHQAMDTRTGQFFTVSSIHHQEMIPGPDANVLMVAHMATEKHAWGTSLTSKAGKSMGDDIEALYYPETQSLCYQPHPELRPKQGTDYFFDLIDEHYFGKELKPEGV